MGTEKEKLGALRDSLRSLADIIDVCLADEAEDEGHAGMLVIRYLDVLAKMQDLAS